MKTVNAQITLGAALIGAFAGFWRWHSLPAKKLTPPDERRRRGQQAVWIGDMFAYRSLYLWSESGVAISAEERPELETL